MAYTKTNWVNLETELNPDNMNHMENGIEKSYGQFLIAVSATAPLECSIGDKYYNTTSNKIFTAVGSDTWDSTGEDAELGVFYIVLETQNIYTYDGETLVSVGGGSGSGGGETLPIGTVLEFPTTDSTKVPDGWLFCDGSAVSRTTYADLFSLIGTSFGAGDGSTTFNLPTKEGLVTVGIKSSDTDFDTIGKTGGEKKHTMTIDELVAHNHKVYAVQAKIGSNTTNINTVDNSSASNWLTSTTGNSQPFNVMQPYVVSNYIIKATQTTPVQAEVVNDHSASQENTYSCDYINTELNTKMNSDNFIIEIVDFGDNTFAANSQKNFTIPNKTGYAGFVLKPIVTKGYNDVYAVYIPANAQTIFGVKNIGSTSYTWGVQCVALYVKNQ